MNFKKPYAVLALAGIISLSYLYYRFNPQHYSFFPKCPFYTITGFDCPGCGSQRAIYCLLHGQLVQAVRFNLLLVLSLPFLLVHFGHKAASVILKKDIRWRLLYRPLTPVVIFTVVLVFWIMRNVPAYPFILLKA
ncbi:hypothetical protein BEL04_18680 [Mucilaginibacter sp. PPCGB 2223]|uniref:DUF2752 domain-containing protein n=1 Tax=Mucilaginibacter sp. PPCGB 2223 TaxID=1886027 RepID=UPI000826F8A0|nr:hypothetical protein BEL04_18680 [Mucilaginibacter sp. PPCGB 2223]